MTTGTKALARCRNIADLRELARRRLPSPMFHYIDGAAEDESTARRNIHVFEEVDLVPRSLVDVGDIDISTTVLGQNIAWPVILAPTGMSRLFHHEGERAVARAAARAGSMYALSSFSSVSIEDVAAQSDGPKMFQIYVLRDHGLNVELVERCRAAGYAALCLTVDVPVGGNRERDLRTGMSSRPRLTLKSLFNIARHPRWMWHFVTSPALEPATLAGKIAEEGADRKVLSQFVTDLLNPSVTWDDAAAMIEQWGGPFAIKGILNAEDAVRAADIGASAVVVSNHGGRQLDGVVASLDVLSQIADAVGDCCEIILDSGVRRGTHVLKALALGAKACMIGRPYLYGLAAGGEAGVDRALAILREEIERDMALLGCRDLADLDAGYVRFRCPAGRPEEAARP